MQGQSALDNHDPLLDEQLVKFNAIRGHLSKDGTVIGRWHLKHSPFSTTFVHRAI
ncbi:hypothetical protein FA13DRAFT_1730533 [Coprinellus micaceus]|uniref:Uncharacterized protein n=1 Tax=Coprinellus micaceus TaxID=71717 RepID=A0A4Y7TH50_COPMI|nr:hypothetical protein FA13DRAFT_1730533 [Coprinellus micaceus]